jgi:hypothetical protein
MSAAESYFHQVCDKPGMFGTPAEVEANLWAAMAIWSAEHLGRERNYVFEAVKAERQKVVLDVKSYSFHDLCAGFEYEPVIMGMTAAFDALKKLKK